MLHEQVGSPRGGRGLVSELPHLRAKKKFGFSGPMSSPRRAHKPTALYQLAFARVNRPDSTVRAAVVSCTFHLGTERSGSLPIIRVDSGTSTGSGENVGMPLNALSLRL
jgi:hypothetical protein